MQTFELPKAIKPYFPKLTGREATMPLRFFVTEKHVKEANKLAGRKSPLNCVLACAGRDQAQAKTCIVLKKVTYIDHLGEDGKRYVFRYRNSEKAIKEIAHYDRTGRWRDFGIPINLLPVNPANTLKKMRRTNRRWHKTMGKALYDMRKAETDLQVAEADVEKTRSRARRLEDTAPSAPRTKEAKQQLRVARETVATCRERVRETRAVVEEYRNESTYSGTGKCTPHTFDARVRNGLGALRHAA